MTIPFWVYDDHARRLTLLRGDVKPLIDEAGVSNRARWSISAKGWVLSAIDAADVLAIADYRDRKYRVKTIGGADE